MDAARRAAYRADIDDVYGSAAGQFSRASPERPTYGPRGSGYPIVGS